jgi:hypothetical protein
MIIKMNELHGIDICEREYVQTICALTPSTLATPFDETT